MYTEVSGLVSRYGIDPREYAVLAFGGAGPMLGCFLAREIKVKEIIVPPSPGTLSALGGLIADLKSDFLKTVYADLGPANLQTVRDEFAVLRQRAQAWLMQEQGHIDQAELVYSAEMRYRGQSYEIDRSEEHTSELQSLMRISYAVFCLKKKKKIKYKKHNIIRTATQISMI